LLKINILVLVSGGGTNLQALLDAEHAGKLGPGKLALVVSDRSGAYALERAKLLGIPIFVEEPDVRLCREDRRKEHSDRIFRLAREHNIRLIVLAGFLSILQGRILKYYAGRILNLHPSLLPKYGGMGMYGNRVHRAVLDAGEKESGCTIHFVDSGTDTGPVLLQRRVPVLPGDTPDALADRIHDEEHIAIVEAATMMSKRLHIQMTEQQRMIAEEKMKIEEKTARAARRRARLSKLAKTTRKKIKLEDQANASEQAIKNNETGAGTAEPAVNKEEQQKTEIQEEK
jgi:phosphoribosylglycinamide formyltransferase-1